MLYTCVQDEMPGLLAFSSLVVAVEDTPFLEALDALDECPGADLRLQGERAMGHLDPDPVPVNLAVAPGGLEQHQVNVLRRLAARALAPMLAREFVVPALEVLDSGPQVPVSTQPLRCDIDRLVGSGHHAQLCHGPAGGQVVVYAGLTVAVHGRKVDDQDDRAEAFEHHDTPSEGLLNVGVCPGVGVENYYDLAAPQPHMLPARQRRRSLCAGNGHVPHPDKPDGRLSPARQRVDLLASFRNPQIPVAASDLLEHQRVNVEGDPAPGRRLVLRGVSTLTPYRPVRAQLVAPRLSVRGVGRHEEASPALPVRELLRHLRAAADRPVAARGGGLVGNIGGFELPAV